MSNPSSPWQQKKEEFQASLQRILPPSLSIDQMTMDQLNDVRNQLSTLHTTITSYLKTEATTYNVNEMVGQIGQLQNDIRIRESKKAEMQVEVDTALAREELLRSRDRPDTSHSLYGLDRPIRRGLIPYLWVLSALFVGVGVLFFYWMDPVLLPSTTGIYGSEGGMFTMLMDVLYSRYTWMALFGAAMIVILFLSLKIAGVFGK